MTIGIVNGNPRQGKTNKIARLGLMRADRGEQVYTNLFLDSPNAHEITPYGLLDLMRSGRSDSRRTIILQEVYAWFNSHKALSSINDFESAFVFQSGKLNFDIFCDSQLIGRVDSCLKDMCSWRCEAVRDDYYKCFRYYWLDVNVRDRNRRLSYPPEIITFKESAKYWSRWNTYTATNPIGFENMLVDMKKSDVGLMDAEIDDQVALLLRNRGLWRKPMRTDVKSALLKLRVAPVFADIVACRLSLVLSQKPELA